MKNLFDLLGRLFLSFIFFYEAYDALKFAKDTKAKMTDFGFDSHQDLLLYGAVFILVFGGALLLSGYRAKLGAILLLAYWIPLTLLVFDFWNAPEETHRLTGVHFMKNVAIMGGLLMVFANGVGKYSIKRLFATSRVRNA